MILVAQKFPLGCFHSHRLTVCIKWGHPFTKQRWQLSTVTFQSAARVLQPFQGRHFTRNLVRTTSNVHRIAQEGFAQVSSEYEQGRPTCLGPKEAEVKQGFHPKTAGLQRVKELYYISFWGTSTCQRYLLAAGCFSLRQMKNVATFPRYPRAATKLLDSMFTKVNGPVGPVVVDLGAGTGKWTSTWLGCKRPLRSGAFLMLVSPQRPVGAVPSQVGELFQRKDPGQMESSSNITFIFIVCLYMIHRCIELYHTINIQKYNQLLYH